MNNQENFIGINDIIEWSGDESYLILITLSPKGIPFYRLKDIYRTIRTKLPSDFDCLASAKKLCKSRGMNYSRSIIHTNIKEFGEEKFYFVSEGLANLIINTFIDRSKIKRSRGRPPKNYEPPELR